MVFTDLVDSTRLGEALGDARAADLWIEHDRRARALFAQHGGREIDRTDGFFLIGAGSSGPGLREATEQRLDAAFYGLRNDSDPTTLL